MQPLRRSRSPTWKENRDNQEAIDRSVALHRAAKNWESAEAYLIETRQLKAFLLWDARREGVPTQALASLERALDKISYPEPALIEHGETPQ